MNLRAPTALELLPFGAVDRGFETMRVTSPFGWRANPLYPARSSYQRTWHNGLDIGNARAGDDVVAAAPGRVIAEGFLLQPWSIPAPASWGWVGNNYGGVMCVIDHGAGRVTVSAHLDATHVDVGDTVAAGDLIGRIGATGSAKGAAHLHFTVLIDGVEVDPWPLIVALGQTREERLTDEVLALRAADPIGARRWAEWTLLTQALDGQPLRRENRLAAEAMYLRERSA